jgi:predicted RNA binding protein with dsRBD fold (UPF0201 family)
MLRLEDVVDSDYVCTQFVTERKQVFLSGVVTSSRIHEIVHKQAAIKDVRPVNDEHQVVLLNIIFHILIDNCFSIYWRLLALIVCTQ